MLAFLLFGGALTVDLTELMRNRAMIFLLSTLGTVLSMFIVALLIYPLMRLLGIALPWLYCLLSRRPSSPPPIPSLLSHSSKAPKHPNLSKPLSPPNPSSTTASASSYFSPCSTSPNPTLTSPRSASPACSSRKPSAERSSASSPALLSITSFAKSATSNSEAMLTLALGDGQPLLYRRAI